MFNFIVVGDVHSADKNPVSRIDNYFEDTFDLLKQIGVIAQKVKADAVLFVGDLFHIKQSRENSYRLMRTWLETLKQYPPVYAIAGNHDEIYNNPDSIPDQPLGLLEVVKALTLLDQRYEKDKVFIKDGLKVRIAGYPYEEKRGVSVCNIAKKDEDWLLILAHIYAAPQKEDMFGTPIYGYNEITPFDPDIICLGHYHKDQGIMQLGSKYLINLGAITRGSLSYEDVKREPKVAWIQIADKKTIQIKKVKLKIKPAEEIFDLVKKEQVDLEEQKLTQYIESLKKELTAIDSEDDIQNKIKKLNLETEIHEMVIHYLEDAGLAKKV